MIEVLLGGSVFLAASAAAWIAFRLLDAALPLSRAGSTASDRAAALFRNGVITFNEARAAMGLTEARLRGGVDNGQRYWNEQ